MELPEHVLAEEMASLDQQELLPVEVSSSAQATGMQPKTIQVDEQTKSRRQLQLALLQKAMARHKLGTLEGVECEDDSSFQQQLQEIMLDPEQFVASNIRNHLPAWQQYFAHFGNTGKSRQVLAWIEHGFSLSFVSVHAASQQVHPRYRENVQAVTDLLQQVVSKDQVPALLTGNRPAQVHFPNRVSCHMYKDFVRETLQSLLCVGALRHWMGKKPPIVISGQGVVKNRKGKLRLILDCRYLNLFLKYSKVKYEQLSDVTAYLQQGHFFVLTDAKSGYHHIPMHENMWQYLAIQFEGIVYVFTVLPFGMAEACGVYTTVMGEVYRPLRLLHQSLTFLIDDALFAAVSKLHAFFLSKTLVMLLTSLGFFLSWEKCQLVPTQRGKFLGLLVDTSTCQLVVPTDKVVYIQGLIEQALVAPSISSRRLASIAGFLMSIAPAVYMAPLYTRRLFQAMSGNEGWDLPVQDSTIAVPDLQYWLDNLNLCNGKTWLKRLQYIHIVGDASSVGFGAFTPHGELPSPMVVSFDAMEIAGMEDNQLSSVLRETKNARLAIQTLIANLPVDQVAGKVCVYTGDCFPAIQNLLKMKGSLQVFPEVKCLYESAAQADLMVDFIWKPRTDADLVFADELSRVIDSSEIFLAPFAFEALCRLQSQFGQAWGVPTLDCFAGHSQGQHQVPRFYSKFYGPGAIAINAMYQNWARDAVVPGRVPLVWVFPPFELIGSVLGKLQVERVDAILVVPKFRRYWQALIWQLPIVAYFDLKFHDRLYTIGSRAPPSMKLNKPIIHFTAYRISFRQ